MIYQLAKTSPFLSGQVRWDLCVHHNSTGSFADELHIVPLSNNVKYDEDNARKTVITVDMKEVKSINKIVLAENIKTGQQVEKFKLYYYFNKRWHKIYQGGTIGRKKVCLLPPMDARRIKLVIEKTRKFATISEFKVY